MPSKNSQLILFEGEMKNLCEVIGWELADENKGYCNSNMRSNLPKYWDWEDKVATPALQKRGYTVIKWRTGDGDSFGPLMRVVLVEKNGVREEMMYG